MLDNWDKIYDTFYEHRAEIVRENLLLQDIDAVIINKKDSNYQIGRYEIYVPKEDTEKAKSLIENDLTFE